MRAAIKAALMATRNENRRNDMRGEMNEAAYNNHYELDNRYATINRYETDNRYELDGRYEMENRRGRQPRDGRGRYMPKNEYRSAEMNEYHDASWRTPEAPYTPPYAPRTEERRKPMNKIGFNTGDEMRTDYETGANYSHMNEMEHRHSPAMMGHGKPDNELTEEVAEEWVRSMRNSDDTTGGHWKMHQTNLLMEQHQVDADPIEFYVAMNAIYSDYAKVFRKYGVGDKLEFYVDMAKAFINDVDAVPNKVAAYYECVVEH